FLVFVQFSRFFVVVVAVGDLYIIALVSCCCQHIFVTFLIFFNDTLGCVGIYIRIFTAIHSPNIFSVFANNFEAKLQVL
ncbi:MAG: hypothetical protein RSC56_04365, partial [Acidaminococcaceae bacterium]